MAEVWIMVKDVLVWVLLAILAFFTWFFKQIYSEHKLMMDFYTKNKDNDVHKILHEMEAIKADVKRVESDSKRYWSEHKIQMEANQKSLMDQIKHTNENNKAGYTGIFQLLERVEKRIDKIEEKINK
jgi:hypothetical protein